MVYDDEKDEFDVRTRKSGVDSEEEEDDDEEEEEEEDKSSVEGIAFRSIQSKSEA